MTHETIMCVCKWFTLGVMALVTLFGLGLVLADSVARRLFPKDKKYRVNIFTNEVEENEEN